jgi:hypothetical protein
MQAKATNLTLRRARSAHLEGWPQARCSFPPFETRPAAAPQGEALAGSMVCEDVFEGKGDV